VGRLGDGWLPSFCTPDDVAAGRPLVEEEAAAAGRAIDPEHWGALIPYLLADGPLPEPLVAAVAARRPDGDVAAVIPAGLPALRAAVERFIAVGTSKFVLVPVVEPEDWTAHLADVGDATLDLVT
jgi:alkanesulfonate monooxygenase SsuD/methylene tetrahydromethanopterin reductase-like flavin-dependent oxidoreductase (luciferase family)